MAHGNPKRKGGNRKKKNRATQHYGGSSSSPPEAPVDISFSVSGDHLNAEIPTPAVRSCNIAAPPCRYFQRGYCRYGENCYYQHCIPEVPPAQKKQPQSKNGSSRYFRTPNPNSIPGGGKKSSSGGFEHMVSMLMNQLPTMGDSSMSDDDDDEMEQRMRNFGFTDDDIYELSLQGINPWDPEAMDALAVLNGWDMEDDEYYCPFDDDDDEDEEDDGNDLDELAEFIMSMNPFTKNNAKVKSSVCIKELTDEEGDSKEKTDSVKKTEENTKTKVSSLKGNSGCGNEIAKESKCAAKDDKESIANVKKTEKGSVTDGTNDKENIVDGKKTVKNPNTKSKKGKDGAALKAKKPVKESNDDDEGGNITKMEKMMKSHGLTHDEAYDIRIAGLEPGSAEADQFLHIRRNGSASDMLRYMHGVKPSIAMTKKSVNCVQEKVLSHNGCAFVVKVADKDENDNDLKVGKIMKAYGLTKDEAYGLIAAGFKPGESEADELLQFLRKGGLKDDEIFELQLRGVKPWEADAIQIITAIRESRI